MGGWFTFDADYLAAWGLSLKARQEGAQPIAFCEAAMVPLAFIRWGNRLRGRNVVWYVDNTPAVSSFVKGTSSNERLEKIVGSLWIMAYHLNINIYFEWFDSKSNWSDGISRGFGKDEVAKRLNIKTSPVTVTDRPWTMEWDQMWRWATNLNRPKRPPTR